MARTAPDEYYHVYNRGMQKQPIFVLDADRMRFLFLILCLQGSQSIKNMSREIKQNVQSRALHINTDLKREVLKNRMVELVHFCLMPNHFHLILREISEDGISKYMHRVQTAYTKYFNVRHERSGHLFQGPYKSIHIEDDEQLMYLSTYIHKNPCELPQWKGVEDKYYWSSYADCINKNRFEELLVPEIVTERFKGRMDEYKRFIKTSVAKEII